jgi:hypothetical protein
MNLRVVLMLPQFNVDGARCTPRLAILRDDIFSVAGDERGSRVTICRHGHLLEIHTVAQPVDVVNAWTIDAGDGFVIEVPATAVDPYKAKSALAGPPNDAKDS